jgi:hypothetical protein
LYTVLVVKPEGRRSLRTPRHRFEESIKMDHKQDGRVWIRYIWLMIGASGRLL